MNRDAVGSGNTTQFMNIWSVRISAKNRVSFYGSFFYFPNICCFFRMSWVTLQAERIQNTVTPLYNSSRQKKDRYLEMVLLRITVVIGICKTLLVEII